MRTIHRGALALVCAMTAAPAAAQTVGLPSVVSDGYERRTGIDVLHYDLAFELPPAPGMVRARARILYEARPPGPLTEIVLDLAEAMRVDSVAVDGDPTLFGHVDGRLVIEAPGTEVGRRGEVVVWYRGLPADGLILGTTPYGHYSVFADNWADRAHHWFPGIDHPSDKATVDFTVDAPAGLEVVANGYLRGVDDLDDGRRRWRWSETAEIPTYGMVFGATDFAITRAGEAGGVEVTHWVFAKDSLAGEVAFERSVEILGFYDSLFGPFPYEKLAHVQSATKFGGMENPTAIFYSDKAVAGTLESDEPDGLTSLVAHETVHQWFGDAVTEMDWNHLWLSEGFATYFAAVFFEFRGGAEGRGGTELSRRMKATRPAVVGFFERTGQAIYDPGPGPGEYEELLNPNNYPKGAWVLHMLRREIGDEAFFETIRDFYATLRDGNAWTADFERIAEEASGKDLGWFFAQWVGRAGHPVLEVHTTPIRDGEAWRVELRQVQEGEPFRVTVDLEIVWEGGSRIETVVLDDRTGDWKFDDVPGPIREVVVDPDAWLLWESASSP